jgi:hypothetical protein
MRRRERKSEERTHRSVVRDVEVLANVQSNPLFGLVETPRVGSSRGAVRDVPLREVDDVASGRRDGEGDAGEKGEEGGEGERKLHIEEGDGSADEPGGFVGERVTRKRTREGKEKRRRRRKAVNDVLLSTSNIRKTRR